MGHGAQDPAAAGTSGSQHGGHGKDPVRDRPIRPTRTGDALFHLAATGVRAVYSLLMTKSWSGTEHLRREGGYIVVANHVTEIDPLTVAYPVYKAGTIPRFLAKESLFRVPALGWLLRETAQIPVFRGSMDANRSLEAARAVVDAGGAVIIYPEGTLTRDPELWPMQGRTGAARLALATGAPVIPMAHWGDQEFLAPKATKPSLFPRKHVRTLVGPPLDLSDLAADSRTGHVGRQALAEATERMMGAITGLLEQVRGEQAPAGRWDPRQNRRVETERPAS